MSARSRIDFRANASNPCPVCNSGSKGCSRTEDGLHLCRGSTSAVEFVRIVEPDDNGFIGYRRRNDDKADPLKQKVQRPKKSTPVKGKDRTITDFTKRARMYVEDLRPAFVDQLANWLQLPVTVFDRIPLLGLSRITDCTPVFGFPEHDANGHVCGITERYRDGRKEMQPGGVRGITVPTGWNTFSQTDETSGPNFLFLAEGASDTLALTAAGLHALGRPAASAGIEFLVELLADPANVAALTNVTIVVMGENDERLNPTTNKMECPGRTGAEKCQQRLSDSLRRPVMLAFPPDGAKDVRAWLTAQPDAAPWADRGTTLVSRLTLTSVDPPLLTPASNVDLADGMDSQSLASTGAHADTSTTQLVEGADPARWDHEPDNLQRLAKLFLRAITPDGEQYYLRFWRDEFHIYRGGYYETLRNGDFNARLTKLISTEFERVHRLELEVWDTKSVDVRGPKPRIRKSTTSLAANVVMVLKGYTILPASINAPAWIDRPANNSSAATRPDPANLVSVRNGYVDIHSGELLQHSPDFFTFARCDFAYNSSAPAPARWHAFLAQLWPNPDGQMEALQEWFGYYLTSATGFQKFLFILGPKRAGKGTIARILTALAGERNVVYPRLESLGNPFGLVPLLNRKLGIVSDLRLGHHANSSAIIENLLSITGEDTVTVDRKYLDSLTLRLNTRFMVMSNEFPRFNDASGAIYSRMILLRLNRSFYGAEDTNLSTSLLDDLPGILLWALAGLRRLLARGRFVQPTAGSEFMEGMGDLGSPVAEFVRDKCILRHEAIVPCSELYEEWCKWCKDNGKKEPNVMMIFSRDLYAASPNISIKRVRQGTERFRVFTGIRLRGMFENENEEPQLDADNRTDVTGPPLSEAQRGVEARVEAQQKNDEIPANLGTETLIPTTGSPWASDIPKTLRYARGEENCTPIDSIFPKGLYGTMEAQEAQEPKLESKPHENAANDDTFKPKPWPKSPNLSEAQPEAHKPQSEQQPNSQTVPAQSIIDWLYVSKKLHTELIPGPLTPMGEPAGLPAIDLAGIVHYRLTADTLIWFEQAIAKYIANEPGRVAIAEALEARAKLHLFADQHPLQFDPDRLEQARQHAATHRAKDLPEWKEPPPF